jgi:hypothetical protein
LARGKRER